MRRGGETCLSGGGAFPGGGTHRLGRVMADERKRTAGGTGGGRDGDTAAHAGGNGGPGRAGRYRTVRAVGDTGAVPVLRRIVAADGPAGGAGGGEHTGRRVPPAVPLRRGRMRRGAAGLHRRLSRRGTDGGCAGAAGQPVHRRGGAATDLLQQRGAGLRRGRGGCDGVRQRPGGGVPVPHPHHGGAGHGTGAVPGRRRHRHRRTSRRDPCGRWRTRRRPWGGCAPLWCSSWWCCG